MSRVRCIRNFYRNSSDEMVTHTSGSYGYTRDLLALVAANASAASRTLTLPCYGLDELSIAVTLTRGGNATTLVVTPTVSVDKGTTYVNVISRAIASGASTISTFVETKTVTGSDSELLIYDTTNITHLKLVFSTNTANNQDFFTVQVSGVENAVYSDRDLLK